MLVHFDGKQAPKERGSFSVNGPQQEPNRII